MVFWVDGSFFKGRKTDRGGRAKVTVIAGKARRKRGREKGRR